MLKPTQDDPQFKLRLTQDLKDALSVSAAQNSRSMNAEILDRLQKSLSENGDALDARIQKATESAVISAFFAFLEEGLMKFEPGDIMMQSKTAKSNVVDAAKRVAGGLK